MYIAFRWLISLVFVMWIAMCFTDYLLKEYRNKLDVYTQPLDFSFGNVSESELIKPYKRRKQYLLKKEEGTASLQLTMFLAGAIAVSIFNRKYEIVLYAKQKIDEMYSKHNMAVLKNCAISFGNTMLCFTQIYWEKFKQLIYWAICSLKREKYSRHREIYNTLLNKLKQVGEERKNLGQLLIAAIHENKHIRMSYQLEMMAKNRLVHNIESTNKQIKENRMKVISYQQLYITTQKENNFLKAKIQKLSKEKEETDKKMMRLMNEIFKSKNIRDLKAYCSRFLIKTKQSLVNWNATAEIETFLKESAQPSSSKQLQRPSLYVSDKSKNMEKNDNGMIEILQKDCLIPVIRDAPKFKGLPGECVWTVKDKNGIIENLYQYDYESEFDNRDTIRRIRQYSVYYDKDCLLDFSNGLPDPEDGYCEIPRFPPTKQKLVTESEAFKNFIRNNKSVVPFRRSRETST